MIVINITKTLGIRKMDLGALYVMKLQSVDAVFLSSAIRVIFSCRMNVPYDSLFVAVKISFYKTPKFMPLQETFSEKFNFVDPKFDSCNVGLSYTIKALICFFVLVS